MRSLKRKSWLSMLVATLFAAGLMVPGVGSAAVIGGIGALNTVPVPLPANLSNFVINTAAAVQLGKALFWDMQAGSDGIQACASCHFHAGADRRTINTVNPGLDGAFTLAQPGGQITAPLFPTTVDDIVGSNGVISKTFNALSGTAVDTCADAPTVFGPHRQVTGRNAPSVINAVFYARNFWDGRAANVFNGANPSGATPQVQMLQIIAGIPTPVVVNLPNASLASQSTGPITSSVEMSCAGRSLAQVGRKLLALTPLANQTVDPTDSVLGPLAAAPPAKGLTSNYPAMIQAAFDPKWWNSPTQVAGFSVMEQNFSLFWGISIMLYESTLISDQSPVDLFLGGNTAALNATEQLGLTTFTGKARCNFCHSGPEMSKATVSQVGNNLLTGFFNTGVRPVAEDGGDVLQPGLAKFKTPTVRNVELNGPYFHNGGKSTLKEVVNFYNRGGDFPNANTDGNIKPLGLTPAEKDALIAFMVACTDPRVKFEKAPFDHPSLTIPNGPNLAATGAAGRTVPIGAFLKLAPTAAK